MSKKKITAGDGLFKIDKGVPMPAQAQRNKYPWADMQVGDSFLCPPTINRASMCSTAASAGRRLGSHYIVRTTKEGLRVWRDK